MLGVRNMLTVVPVPKSNTRDQLLIVSSRTQVAMEKSLSPLTKPVGKLTYWFDPLKLIA